MAGLRRRKLELGMRVTGPNRGANLTGAKKKTQSTGGDNGFSPTASSVSGAASGATPAGSITSLDAIIALQSVDDATEGRKRAVRRGHDLLDVLEDLKLDLLAGRIEPDRLKRLVGLLKNRAPADDPILSEITQEIELRARVELAKLGEELN